MKKILLFLLLACSVNAFGQLQLGVKGGVNVSNFTGGNFDSVKKNPFVSYHVGGFVRIMLGKLAIQPELLLSSQGAKLEYAGKEDNFTITYLNIPIMLQYEFEGGLYLEAGPQFGFKVDESVPDSLGEDFAKNSDQSVAFGLGYHGKGGFGIGARYAVGLSKVGNFENANIDSDFHNGVLQISLFFTLFNNKKNEQSAPVQ